MGKLGYTTIWRNGAKTNALKNEKGKVWKWKTLSFNSKASYATWRNGVQTLCIYI